MSEQIMAPACLNPDCVTLAKCAPIWKGELSRLVAENERLSRENAALRRRRTEVATLNSAPLECAP